MAVRIVQSAPSSIPGHCGQCGRIICGCRLWQKTRKSTLIGDNIRQLRLKTYCILCFSLVLQNPNPPRSFLVLLMGTKIKKKKSHNEAVFKMTKNNKGWDKEEQWMEEWEMMIKGSCKAGTWCDEKVGGTCKSEQLQENQRSGLEGERSLHSSCVVFVCISTYYLTLSLCCNVQFNLFESRSYSYNKKSDLV